MRERMLMDAFARIPSLPPLAKGEHFMKFIV